LRWGAHEGDVAVILGGSEGGVAIDLLQGAVVVVVHHPGRTYLKNQHIQTE
jgi:hypothetical protein